MTRAQDKDNRQQEAYQYGYDAAWAGLSQGSLTEAFTNPVKRENRQKSDLTYALDGYRVGLENKRREDWRNSPAGQAAAEAERRREAKAQDERDRAYEWDMRFMKVAGCVASWSKDPSTQVGAVLVFDKCVVSTGYNGVPRALPDTNLDDRPSKYSRTIHAEMNALFNAMRVGANGQGCTLYVSGLPPCDRCAVHLIQAGVKRVVFWSNLAVQNPTWMEAWHLSGEYFEDAGVEVGLINTKERP